MQLALAALVLVAAFAAGRFVARMRQRRPTPTPTREEIDALLGGDADEIGDILDGGDAALVLRRPTWGQRRAARKCGWDGIAAVVRLDSERRQKFAEILDGEHAPRSGQWLRTRERDAGKIIVLNGRRRTLFLHISVARSAASAIDPRRATVH